MVTIYPIPAAKLIPPTNEPVEFTPRLEQWGTPEQWEMEHETQGVFAFSDYEIRMARRREGGFLGCICGVGCYVKDQPPRMAG